MIYSEFIACRTSTSLPRKCLRTCIKVSCNSLETLSDTTSHSLRLILGALVEEGHKVRFLVAGNGNVRIWTVVLLKAVLKTVVLLKAVMLLPVVLIEL